MSRLCVNCVLVHLLASGIATGSVEAQVITQKQVVFLPLASRTDEQTLAEDLYRQLFTSIHLNPLYRLSTVDELESLLTGVPVSELLSSESRMSEFCDRSEIDFLIGGVIERTVEGNIALSLIVFSRDEEKIISLIDRTYENEGDALSGMEALAGELSRRRHYLTTDTSLFLSIVIPGLGQLQMQKPVHALVSAGLVAGSLAYWASTKKADSFEFPGTDYSYLLDPATEEYSYFYQGRQVSKVEFITYRNEDLEHSLTAKAERRAADIRNRRAVALFCTAYVINLLDAIILSRQKIDPTPFFLSLEAEPPALSGTNQRELRLRLVLYFR